MSHFALGRDGNCCFSPQIPFPPSLKATNLTSNPPSPPKGPNGGRLNQNVAFSPQKPAACCLARGGGRLFLTVFPVFSLKTLGVEEEPQRFWVGRSSEAPLVPGVIPGVVPGVVPGVLPVVVSPPPPPPPCSDCAKKASFGPKMDNLLPKMAKN